MLVLESNGGIIISKRFAFVESLDWLGYISKNIFINRGKAGILPRVFGYYNISRSSPRMQNGSRTSDNRFKFLVKYPGIMYYFLAAVKGSSFVCDVLNEMSELLQNPPNYIMSAEKYRKVYKSELFYLISQNKVYNEYF
jgi:hypothetical protein